MLGSNLIRLLILRQLSGLDLNELLHGIVLEELATRNRQQIKRTKTKIKTND